MEIVFLGGAKEVGASCVLIKAGGKNILIDSGIRMKEDKLPNLQLLRELGGVDVCLISHAHLDHIGSLPLIAREYPHIFFYANQPTKDLIKVLLYDSLRIMEIAEDEIPIYAEKNVEDLLDRTLTYGFNYTFEPIEGIKVTFFPAGHILGASMIFIQTQEGSILYTGDFSADRQLTVDKASVPKIRPDVVICESTYGDRLHTNRNFEEERLFNTVAEVISQGGKVLIPAFAIGRAQEIILILRNYMKKRKVSFNVFIDGMVREVIRVYRNNPTYLSSRYYKRVLKGEEIFFADNINVVSDKKQREEIISSSDPCVIISSSGMLTGGPSVFYAEKIVQSQNALIAITGYQDEEAPGRKLLELAELPENERKIELNGKEYEVKCRVEKYGLSAHSDRDRILGFLATLRPRTVIFAHGSEDAILQISDMAVKELEANIIVPQNGEINSISIEKPRKQLSFFNVKKLNNQELLNEENLKLLWQYLVENKQESNHITAEHAILIWNGKEFLEKDEVNRVFELLKKSVYFEQNPRKPYLFRILSAQEVEERLKPKPMEQNKMRELAFGMFSEYGLYKVGMDIENKVVTFYFHFPAVSKKIEEKIKEFENLTLWKVDINPNVNLTYASEYIKNVLKGYNVNLLKFSYNPVINAIVARIKEDFEEMKTVSEKFLEETGVSLIFDVEGKKQEEKIDLQKPRMEQNKALLLIDLYFENEKDKIYKKSIKEGGKYIELSFVTPFVGERYKDKIEELSEKTGWDIKVSQSINQVEMINILKEILSKYSIEIQKNPSIYPSTREVKIKLSEGVQEEILKKISDEFFERTGFYIKI
ncbi:Cft2 family RNA processing exonuclease [Caldicellulosiruptor bescii]|uniref:Beta-lactamase domain protein n=2 Tax=Caldicellulosiruptor bescii TaxID=31899 RepID=B9ML17_CALBD|nr:MBL fold metallo-hydrolase [Caldicellulosiruptor bescii]ACM61025.1 beta-lactamase domain protein [Caldicellulosiruptor bescii DSM 6725]PBC89161.1 Cft2 family RNA processing exonuclease [Caldicellulosiruptor bescii]PBC91357.1 Cft2 family RNA processing exonuclease [Caldicellulosiruptor bescii]PBD03231.1 Cft2 family RNA processing exonuclease [Caldicellulosiruptor bescii]PBD07155.1 Cft2 family RNA processing exonuclease [Caldicellulosiruptor bescii]